MSYHVTTSSRSDPFFQGFGGGSPTQSEIQGNVWKTEIDITGFRYEDVQLSVNATDITVHCVQEEGGSKRETRRQLQAPDGTDTSKLESTMSNAGMLVLTAPYDAPKDMPTNNNDPFMNKSFGFSNMSGGMQSRMRGFDNLDDGSFLTKVVLKNFYPSEIQIRAGGGRIKVKASSKEGVRTRMVDRSFDLPASVNMAALSAILLADGTMFIGAPVPESIQGQRIEITKE